MVGCRRPSSLLAIASFLLPLINISHASLMTRIGLRLGGKHSSVSHQVGTHRSRVPWAVKIQREEEQEEWGKKDKERVRARVAEQEEGEGGKACVGICYYNKLVALEAKEELTRHNEVYKQNVVVPDVVCPGGKCGFSEEEKDPGGESKRREVNEAVTGSAEGDVEGEGPDIYIDDAVDEEEEEEKAETSHPA